MLPLYAQPESHHIVKEDNQGSYDRHASGGSTVGRSCVARDAYQSALDSILIQIQMQYKYIIAKATRYTHEAHCLYIALEIDPVAALQARCIQLQKEQVLYPLDSPGAHRGLELSPGPLVEAAETWTAVREAGAARALLTTFLPARKLGAAFRAVKVAAIIPSSSSACESPTLCARASSRQG